MNTLEVAQLTRQFEKIGAHLRVETVGNTGRRSRSGVEPYTLDVSEHARSSREESYILRVRPEAYSALNLDVLDSQPHLRHLLLRARPLSGETEIGGSRFLCGHDERHWFVAAVENQKGAPTGVAAAMESLKPRSITRLQHDLGVRGKDWNRRKNAAFLRQGEWFFVPLTLAPRLRPMGRIEEYLILHNEAIRRSDSGKPHLVEFLYREGGEQVMVCSQRPQGITEAQHAKLLEQRPEARTWNWQALRRNMAVYAKGRVRHSDHATITLPDWHRVLMSGEVLSPRVSFLD